jgi:hypothetical protein
MIYDPSSVLGEVLHAQQAAAAVRTYLPGLDEDPGRAQLRHGILESESRMVPEPQPDPAAWEAFFAEPVTLDRPVHEPVSDDEAAAVRPRTPKA